MSSNKAYARLLEELRDIGNLNAASAVLEWDQEVCMPPKGAAARARQLATLSALSHERFIAPETGALIQQAQDEQASLNQDEQALLREAAYDYHRAVRIPASFMRAFAEARSRGYHAWLDARKQNNYALFLPHLQQLAALSREKAEHLGYVDSPYDALLEEYERGMTVKQLRPLFAALAASQSALTARIVESGNQQDLSWTDQAWDVGGQVRFAEQALRDMGYDFDAGRQDLSAHPFTTNFSIGDVRITTRLNERDLFSALFGSIHEGGHALYEQGFRPEDEGTCLAQAPSLGMHESQSRLWENIIGRSLPFWRHYLPLLRETFPGQLDAVEAEQMYAAANRVAPSLIRVEADECTYNLHVILRFEIECDLIEGRLDAADAPAAWNAKVQDFLGLDVPDDASGCLQDIHWSHGAFGYFPTYALGNLYAAQLHAALLADMPDMWEQVERGCFGNIVAWLRKRVHQTGRRCTAPETIRQATGRPPAPEAFLSYLESKYASLYNL